MKHNQGNIVILLLAGALVIALVAGGFFIWQRKQLDQQPTPTQNKTYNWQKINNEENGFSLEIPASWKADGVSINSPNIFSYIAPDGSELRIEVNAANNLTLQDYIAEADRVASTAWEGQKSKDVLSIKDITIAGLPAIEREEDWLAAGFNSTVVYMIANNNAYTISIIPKDPNPKVKSDVQKNFPEVLSKLQFNNSNEIGQSTKSQFVSKSRAVFNHPENYDISESDNGLITIYSPVSKQNILVGDDALLVYILISNQQKGDSLEKYYREITENPQWKQEFRTLKKEYIQIGETNMIYQLVENLGMKAGEKTENYYFLMNGRRVLFAKIPAQTSRTEEFNQILSTFKFL